MEVFVLLQYSTFTEMISKEKCNGSVSSQQLSIPYCSWGSTQTPVSAPSILENNAPLKTYSSKAFGKASWKRIFQQDSWLEKRLYKLPDRPLSVTFSPTFPEKSVKSYKAYIYLSPQYAMEQEERISITELLSGIDSVSRALENEKKENFSSLRSLDLPCASYRPYGIPGFQITHKGNVYQDWRGMIAPNPVKEYSQVRQKSVKGKEIMVDFQANKKKTITSSAKSERRNMSDKRHDLQTQKKVKKNVTRLDIFEASPDSRKHPSSREVLKAVICIQRYVRGWIENKAFKRVKIKSTSHGPSLQAVVRYYCKIIAHIKCAGVLDLSTPLHYFELEEWMDKKKSSTVAVRSTKKHQAIEKAFTLFPPLGAKVKNLITVLLPWVRPLMDGKGESNKLAFSHQKSKKTDFQVSAALATSSMREGKENHFSDQDFSCHCMKSSW
ncbi:LOW QUALITY PROTEIN: IQ domain-containing protein M [Ciconia maguari]